MKDIFHSISEVLRMRKTSFTSARRKSWQLSDPGVARGLLRFSAGIEHKEVLVADVLGARGLLPEDLRPAALPVREAAGPGLPPPGNTRR